MTAMRLEIDAIRAPLESPGCSLQLGGLLLAGVHQLEVPGATEDGTFPNRTGIGSDQSLLHWHSSLYGGSYGVLFDDLETQPLGKISSIKVYHGDTHFGIPLVTGIVVTYEKCVIKHGSSHANSSTFVIPDDEWLVGIEGGCGGALDRVEFILSSGSRSGVFGGVGGGPFSEHKAGSIITAFFGRQDRDTNFLLGLGVHFGVAPSPIA